jgi:hypothetical protein
LVIIPNEKVYSCIGVNLSVEGLWLSLVAVFGGTVLKLGTERHHSKLLKGIDTLDDVGCFGLTELGCVGMRTYPYHLHCFYCGGLVLPLLTMHRLDAL